MLSKLKCRGFRATSLSTYDFSTLYTTLPHNLIKEKLLALIEWTFKRALNNYGSLYLACNDRKAFFTSSDQSRYTLWSCQNVCDALSYHLDNIYIRFGTKLYRQIVGIPMGTNCAPLVADLFLYCYEKGFMDSLNHDNQADVIEAFNSTSLGSLTSVLLIIRSSHRCGFAPRTGHEFICETSHVLLAGVSGGFSSPHLPIDSSPYE